MSGLDDSDAIEAALAVLRGSGIDISSPRDGDLDDLEQERFNAVVDACRAYADRRIPSQVAPANPAQVTEPPRINGRDIYEVANQLEGYVDESTPEALAQFLRKEGKAAADLADEIVRLTAAIGAGAQAVAGDEPTVEMSAAGMRLIKSTPVEHFHKYAGGIANSVYDAMRKAAPLSQPNPADERVVEALRKVRALFDVEYGPDPTSRPSIGYDSEALPKVIAILDDALSAKEGR